ncbi:hypothetical protein [Pseudomonas sp. TWP3-2]|uniref:hypothetical protein n=1 Tax=Pseudomonas sp. TWP3-2 TaxID=2804574 RepID=UPI003CEEE04C
MSDQMRQMEHDTAQGRAASTRLELMLIGMRVAKASTEDIRCAMGVMSFLEALEFGILPDCLTSDPEAAELAPEPFNVEDQAVCQKVLRKLLEINEGASLGRVVINVRALFSPHNQLLDFDSDVLKLHPRLAQGVQASAGGWRALSGPGQVQPGDHLSFTVGGKPLCVKAREVLFAGTDREEVVYNRRRNHYFITAMALAGNSSHKDVLVRAAGGVQ